MRGVVVSRNPSVPAPSSAYAVGLKRATVGGRSPAVPPEPRRGMVLSDAAGPLLLPHLTSRTTNATHRWMHTRGLAVATPTRPQPLWEFSTQPWARLPLAQRTGV